MCKVGEKSPQKRVSSLAELALSLDRQTSDVGVEEEKGLK